MIPGIGIEFIDMFAFNSRMQNVCDIEQLKIYDLFHY